MSIMKQWLKLQKQLTMEKDNIVIELDLHSGAVPFVYELKQADHNSRLLEIRLTKHNKTSIVTIGDSIVTLFILKPDDEIVTIKSSSIVQETGTVFFNLTAQSLATVGKIKCEVVIVGADDSLLSFPMFELPVTESVHNKDGIISSSELSILVDALNRVEDFQGQINSVLDTAKTQYKQEYDKQATEFNNDFNLGQRLREEEFATWKNTSISLDPIVALQDQINNMPYFEIIEDGEE